MRPQLRRDYTRGHEAGPVSALTGVAIGIMHRFSNSNRRHMIGMRRSMHGTSGLMFYRTQ
jgi:hypothetical protein